MGKGRLTYKGTVCPWHCDHMGHMNVMYCVGKFDEATWDFFAGLGLTPDAMRSTGTGMAAVDLRITYKRELLPGDTVEVFTRPIEARGKALKWIHEMIDCGSGEVAATCELTALHLDTVKRKSIPLPDSVIEVAGSLME